MDTTSALAQTDRLSRMLDMRRPLIDARFDAYRGKTRRLKFASDDFAQFNSRRFAGFSDNWCSPVANPTAERMTHEGIILPGQERADEDALRVWAESDADRGSSEAYVAFCVASRAYAMVSPGDEGPRISWEHPGKAIVDTDPRTGEPRFGLVAWVDDTFDYATLYTPTEVWKWRRRTQTVDLDRRIIVPRHVQGGWEPIQGEHDDTWPIENPFGKVPLVEMQNQTLLDDDPISDIDGVMAMQDAINLVWAYLLNMLDWSSLPGRIVTGAEMPKMPVLDANGQKVGEKPVDLNKLIQERILWVPGKDAKAQEWSAAKLDVFSGVIEKAVEHIAAQTRTPPHYLVAKMVNTSGDALTVAEAGLVSKVRERITYVTAAHRRIYELVFLALGEGEKARAARTAQLQWADIEYRSEAQRADALLKKRQMGYPVRYLLERDGLGPAEVERVMQMIRDEQGDPYLDLLSAKGGAGAAAGAPVGG